MDINEKLVRSIVENIISNSNLSSDDDAVPVGVSNRHIHLTREHLDILFGKGYELNVAKMLMGNDFASKELVTIVGPSLRPIENVRVLGPLRSKTQVEISRTDTFVLKVKPPVRPSGDIAGSAGITVIGPKGVVTLSEGCIIANRHIHMTPKDAEKFGVKDGDYVNVLAETDEKKTMFYDVQIRVNDLFRLEMHIDTDDANAACLNGKSKVRIVK